MQSDTESDAEIQDLSLRDVLPAYMAMMNSRPFSRLLEIFSPHVAGGQFDLSPRYVNQIPVPHLFVLSSSVRIGQIVARLSALGNKPRLLDDDWRSEADRLTIELYGNDIFNQV